METHQITPPEWTISSPVKTVLAAFAQAGEDIRFIGGCVRDAILERPVTDIDFATPAKPENIQRILEGAGIKAIPTGIEHGTITAAIHDPHEDTHHNFEITTLRQDVVTDGRHAEVAFTDNWQEDAARRDFTMNALSMDASGQVYDYFDGITDARAGHVRFVGDPRLRIQEDYLRVLRYFRFHAHYALETPDNELLELFQENAGHLKALSAERVRGEILKLLHSVKAPMTLNIMEKCGVWQTVIPVSANIQALAHLIHLEMELDLMASSLRLLGATLKMAKKDLSAVAKALVLTRHEKKWFQALCDPAYAKIASQPAHVALYRLGPEMYRDLLLVQAATTHTPVEDLQGLLAQADDWQQPNFALTGEDAQDLGLSGAAIGNALKAVEDWWVTENFSPDREACLKKLAEFS